MGSVGAAYRRAALSKPLPDNSLYTPPAGAGTQNMQNALLTFTVVSTSIRHSMLSWAQNVLGIFGKMCSQKILTWLLFRWLLF